MSKQLVYNQRNSTVQEHVLLGLLFTNTKTRTQLLELPQIDVEKVTYPGSHGLSPLAQKATQAREEMPEASQTASFSFRAIGQRVRQGRVLGLINYLKDISAGTGEERLVAPNTARLAFTLWASLWLGTRYKLPVPDACPAADGSIFYTWQREEHHLELQVMPEGPAEFFYTNEATGALWECEYTLGEPTSAELLDKLRLFV
jgi:hypothetical protein